MKTKTSKHQIKTSFFELYHLRWHQIFQIIYFYEIFYMKVLKVSFLELDFTKLTRNSEKKANISKVNINSTPSYWKIFFPYEKRAILLFSQWVKKRQCIMLPAGEHPFLRLLSTAFLKTISNFEVLKSTSIKLPQKYFTYLNHFGFFRK